MLLRLVLGGSLLPLYLRGGSAEANTSVRCSVASAGEAADTSACASAAVFAWPTGTHLGDAGSAKTGSPRAKVAGAKS